MRTTTKKMPKRPLYNVSWAYGMFILFILFLFYSTNYFLDTTHLCYNIHHLTIAITHHDDKGQQEMRGGTRKRPRDVV